MLLDFLMYLFRETHYGEVAISKIICIFYLRESKVTQRAECNIVSLGFPIRIQSGGKKGEYVWGWTSAFLGHFADIILGECGLVLAYQVIFQFCG